MAALGGREGVDGDVIAGGEPLGEGADLLAEAEPEEEDVGFLESLAGLGVEETGRGGGAEPLDYVKAFGPRIRHVHWKDMAADMKPKRGTMFGCGMAVIPLGDGVVDIPAIVAALKKAGFDGATTLEVAGPDNVKKSAERLRKWCGA